MITPEPPPLVALSRLDDLWFQVAGTLCNLSCHHCFISCTPHNRSFGFLSLDDVRRWLAESQTYGVKEYYFTGGEPFLNRALVPMLAETLRYGPATVLTNGTVLKDEWLVELAAAEAASLYSLEFRVSLDGCTAEMNDPIRGAGTFERTLRGVVKLVEHDFLPIVTIARTWSPEAEGEVIGRFLELLISNGYARPRLKILPLLQIGAEEARSRPYAISERVTSTMLEGFEVGQLICEHSRTVTDRGVYVCPILIETPAARLGDSLAEAARPFAIDQGACYTCYQFGAICSNPTTKPGRHV